MNRAVRRVSIACLLLFLGLLFWLLRLKISFTVVGLASVLDHVNAEVTERP